MRMCAGHIYQRDRGAAGRGTPGTSGGTRPLAGKQENFISRESRPGAVIFWLAEPLPDPFAATLVGAAVCPLLGAWS